MVERTLAAVEEKVEPAPPPAASAPPRVSLCTSSWSSGTGLSGTT